MHHQIELGVEGSWISVSFQSVQLTRLVVVQAMEELELWQLLVVIIVLGVQCLAQGGHSIVGVNYGPGVGELVTLALGQGTQQGIQPAGQRK